MAARVNLLEIEMVVVPIQKEWWCSDRQKSSSRAASIGTFAVGSVSPMWTVVARVGHRQVIDMMVGPLSKEWWGLSYPAV